MIDLSPFWTLTLGDQLVILVMAVAIALVPVAIVCAAVVDLIDAAHRAVDRRMATAAHAGHPGEFEQAPRRTRRAA